MAKADTTRGPTRRVAAVGSKADTKPVADLVRELSSLLDETGLTEIEYGRDGWHPRKAPMPSSKWAIKSRLDKPWC